MSLASENRSRAADIAARHGREAVAFHGITAGFEVWYGRDDSCVFYFDTGSAWVALGSPVAPLERTLEAASAFIAAAEEKGRRARFFAVESDSPLLTDETLDSLHIGEQPEWVPSRWQASLSAKRSLREQLRRARAKGVETAEVNFPKFAKSGEKRAELQTLATRWQASKPMPPMTFAVSLTLFESTESRRLFCARREGKLVGALIASPIGSSGSWFLEDLLRAPEAPNGTMELLFDTAMSTFATEGSERVTMGLAPLSGVRSRPLRAARASTPWLYDWYGLRDFKAKLRPESWQPIHLVFPRSTPSAAGAASAITDSLRCFANGSLLGFARDLIVHRRRSVLWLLAALLIPWTAAMTMTAAAPFFPSEEIRLGWFLFDALMFAGLVRLAVVPTKPLAQLIAIGAGLDMALGVAQLITWNVAHTSGIGWLPVGLSLIAPLIACALLSVLALGANDDSS